MQESFYLGKKSSTNKVYSDMDLNLELGIQEFFHLDILKKYQHVNCITIRIPTCQFFDTIIDVDC